MDMPRPFKILPLELWQIHILIVKKCEIESHLFLFLLFQHSYLLKWAKNFVKWKWGLPQNNFHKIWTEI